MSQQPQNQNQKNNTITGKDLDAVEKSINELKDLFQKQEKQRHQENQNQATQFQKAISSNEQSLKQTQAMVTDMSNKIDQVQQQIQKNQIDHDQEYDAVNASVKDLRVKQNNNTQDIKQQLSTFVRKLENDE